MLETWNHQLGVQTSTDESQVVYDMWIDWLLRVKKMCNAHQIVYRKQTRVLSLAPNLQTCKTISKIWCNFACALTLPVQQHVPLQNRDLAVHINLVFQVKSIALSGWQRGWQTDCLQRTDSCAWTAFLKSVIAKVVWWPLILYTQGIALVIGLGSMEGCYTDW